jgi:hypothetical protein
VGEVPSRSLGRRNFWQLPSRNTLHHRSTERSLSPQVVDQQAANLVELDDNGKLVMGGPLLERTAGLIVVRTGSAAEAMAPLSRCVDGPRSERVF